jgi:uncharacterized Tic20 family protein
MGLVFLSYGGMMTEQTVTSRPAQNDKIMAALAHVSAIMPFLGVIAPIVIWVTQKEKSEYVAFQALQAIVYQLLMIFAWFVGMGCYMLSFFSIFLTIPFAGSGSDIDPSATPFFMLGFFVPFIIFGAIFIGGAIFIIYGMVGAIMTFQGKDFHYVVIGKRLVRYLEKN